MRTYLDCIPCFMKGALTMARLADGNEIAHKEILDEISKMVSDISLNASPPEMSRLVHKAIERKFGKVDLYYDIKQQSNKRAMEIYPRIKEIISLSKDSFLTAIEFAIAGNIIDYATNKSLDMDVEIEKLFSSKFLDTNKTVFDYDDFKVDFNSANKILYLADNAGEIVFDKIFIEEFPLDKEVIFAVRDKPVLNDALIEDAKMCGIDKIVKVISSGVDAPGTVLKYCSDEFLDIYKNADLIISKGQGNYEALSQEKENIYFLFRAKCPIIAQHAEVLLGDVVLQKGIK